jgi:3-methyl-2-oxobutanoate hydroxymethyltransferase
LIARLREKRKAAQPIVSITAYDYFTALLALNADVDFVLVGDSLGNVVQGADTTIGVTLEQAIYHTQIVCRHFPAQRVLLDMPFGTFKLDARSTVQNCIRAFKDSGCGGVKFEGATADNLIAVRNLVEAGVPVLGHIGLLPQRVHSEGGFRMQGKTPQQAQQIEDDARQLQQAGAFAVVLESIPEDVAKMASTALDIPTIGIGAGPYCDGQVLVSSDMLGLFDRFVPSFVKQYANLAETVTAATRSYVDDVREGRYPQTLSKISGVPNR